MESSICLSVCVRVVVYVHTCMCQPHRCEMVYLCLCVLQCMCLGMPSFEFVWWCVHVCVGRISVGPLGGSQCPPAQM